MKRLLAILAVAMSLSATNGGDAEAANPKIKMETSQGAIVLELDQAKAPESVANFLAYVRAGFFDGTIFHRVIPDFMIQGGGFTADFEQKKTRDPIKNEAANGLLNSRGTIAMARTSDPHSATAQFFINLKDNAFLDHGSRGWGYAVFGKVTEGMETVDRIAAQPTGSGGPFGKDVPRATVTIQRVTIVSN